MNPTNPDQEVVGELRDILIDKLDDQRFGDNIVNKKLLYKDIEWIIDELLPIIATEVAKAEKNIVNTLHRNIDMTFNLIERIQPGYSGSPQIDARDLQKLLCDFEAELTKEKS